ncbi:hypothetical protein ASPZODRAFT_1130721 [Penicilliopsis zonata CBS 506.65]|uniref:Uncharacterized protein n=1 Tax=Penicilliopsis zonata CBS 506.65 TaxID=1073090 RepID=A0A1L9SSX4_9EURO|nr:hypothetical protein ASPZODRAFT_1130721 [Penicilliopsis zonata CBS 506.65]OJJ50201.1 hypothetical protein ASPZODRAFT_1130721 [Penicilliopsis zonata CBS 506.65]
MNRRGYRILAIDLHRESSSPTDPDQARQPTQDFALHGVLARLVDSDHRALGINDEPFRLIPFHGTSLGAVNKNQIGFPRQATSSFPLSSRLHGTGSLRQTTSSFPLASPTQTIVPCEWTMNRSVLFLFMAPRWAQSTRKSDLSDRRPSFSLSSRRIRSYCLGNER